MGTVVHELEVQATFGEPDCTGYCSCGWETKAPSTKAAIDAWENHCDVAFMESTMDGAA